MFFIYMSCWPSLLLADRGICVCICVCSCMCYDRYSCAYTSTCRHMQIYMCLYRPTLLVTFTSVYIHAYPAMQSTYTQVCCNKPIVFFFSAELPNAGSRRLAIVVILIPRFLLQLASKQHCKFPNNWDEVLCKSPSRH